jgi:hypothetical protein
VKGGSEGERERGRGRERERERKSRSGKENSERINQQTKKYTGYFA